MPRTATAVFTEADLAWVGPTSPSAADPPTHLDLTRVCPSEDDDENDILAALEAVSTPRRPPALSVSPAPSSLPDLSFTQSPAPPGPLSQDLLAAHLLRRSTHPSSAPASFSAADLSHASLITKTPPRMVSPTDITWRDPPRAQPADFPVSQLQGSFMTSDLPLDVGGESPLLTRADPYNPRCSGHPRVRTEHSCASVRPGASTITTIPSHSSYASAPSLQRKAINKPRRVRNPAVPMPSRFCHICARTQKSRKMFCANLKTDRKCRKSVCEPCFIELSWDFSASDRWLCPHCRGICHTVPRARCHIYNKTNEKRKAAKRGL